MADHAQLPLPILPPPPPPPPPAPPAGEDGIIHFVSSSGEIIEGITPRVNPLLDIGASQQLQQQQQQQQQQQLQQLQLDAEGRLIVHHEHLPGALTHHHHNN